jgi:Mitochondrial PGP phosphatase
MRSACRRSILAHPSWIWPPVVSKRSAFGAGRPGKEAERLEALLGIPVLRHAFKKPAGGRADIENHFG